MNGVHLQRTSSEDFRRHNAKIGVFSKTTLSSLRNVFLSEISSYYNY